MLKTNDRAVLAKTIFDGISTENTQAIDQMFEQIRLAIGLVTRLRGPNGCPWDREQNHLTLRQYLIEEAYEVLEVLDRYHSTENPKDLARQSLKTEFVKPDGAFSPNDRAELLEELGDLLLQIVLHAQLAWERKEFDFGDVAERMAAKLVSRHPHVFGQDQVSNSEQVLVNWEVLKKQERALSSESADVVKKKGLLDGLPKNLPSLQRAARIGEKANRIGFDWKDWQGSWAKVEEETRELREAIDGGNSKEIEHELGDLFFALCNLSRHLKITPEDAHRKAIDRFQDRFHALEAICDREGIDIQTATLEKLDEVWERVKIAERA